MAQSNSEKQQTLRDRRKAAGLHQYVRWVSDKEKVAMDKKLKQLRKGN
jgi:hypothetical protein